MGEYCLRLLLATLCGGLVGAERSLRHKEAGVRTHSILALATTLFMILSKYAFFGDQGGADPTMIACQIVMGINFLSMGIIFRTKQVVSHGLTTAAGIWGTAAIGMACGSGLKLLAVLFTLLMLGLQLLLHHLPFLSGHTPQEIKLTVLNTPEAWAILQQLQQHYEIRVLSARFRTKAEPNTVKLILQVQMPRSIPMEEALHLMDQHHEIKEISV